MDLFYQKQNKLKQELLLFLGEDANIRICYVDEIPRLHSEKQKVTLNNYSKSKQTNTIKGAWTF